MKRFLLISVAAALILSACGAMASAPQRSYDYAEPAAAPELMLEAPAEGFAPEPAVDFASNATGAGGFEAAAVERLVIQNADLSIVVIDPEAKMDEIGKMVESMGGFVVSKNVYQTYTSNNIKVPEGNITVRVPAEKLEQALEQIKADAVEVQNETRSGQDVTREYVDLKSRLKTHEAGCRTTQQNSGAEDRISGSDRGLQPVGLSPRADRNAQRTDKLLRRSRGAFGCQRAHHSRRDPATARNRWLEAGRCGARCAPDADQFLPGVRQFPDLADHPDHPRWTIALRLAVGGVEIVPLRVAQVVPAWGEEEKRARRK